MKMKLFEISRNSAQTSVDSAVRIFVKRVFECPDFELELDFDRQTTHSNSGQTPDSAVRRRLIQPRNGSVCYKKIQGIICGSGLGPIADQIDDPICLDYNEIPHLQKIGLDLFANLKI